MLKIHGDMKCVQVRAADKLRGQETKKILNNTNN